MSPSGVTWSRLNPLCRCLMESSTGFTSGHHFLLTITQVTVSSDQSSVALRTCEQNVLSVASNPLIIFHRTAGPDATIGVTAGYTCKDTQGAVLVLNSPARSEGLFDSVSLRDYMRRHHGEWYDYARNVLDQNVSREGVVLVTGWSKTSADWKAVAFTRSTFGYYGSLEARAMSVAGAGVRGSRMVEIEPPMMHREGALYPRALAQSIGGGEPGTDQCAFLKRCKLKWRGVFRKIVGAAGYHYLPRDKDGGADAREGGVSAAQGEEDEEDLSSYFESKVSATVHVRRCRDDILIPARPGSLIRSRFYWITYLRCAR